MTHSTTPRRPARPHAALVAVILVVIAALGTGLVIQAAHSGPPGSSPGATSPAAASPGSSNLADWAAVQLGELPVVATLEAAEHDDAGVAPGASFTLASRFDEPARALAERLQVSPAAEFAIVPSADGRSATLTPKAALTAGRTYRVALRTPDGAPAGSWAFHVRGPVNVTSTLPGDATTGVPVRTGIEVTFDQDDVATMQSHFTISPTVEGRFERHGPGPREGCPLPLRDRRRGRTTRGAAALRARCPRSRARRAADRRRQRDRARTRGRNERSRPDDGAGQRLSPLVARCRQRHPVGVPGRAALG